MFQGCQSHSESQRKFTHVFPSNDFDASSSTSSLVNVNVKALAFCSPHDQYPFPVLNRILLPVPPAACSSRLPAESPPWRSPNSRRPPTRAHHTLLRCRALYPARVRVVPLACWRIDGRTGVDWLQSTFRSDVLGRGVSLRCRVKNQGQFWEDREKVVAYMPTRRYLVPSSRQRVRCLPAMSLRDCILLDSTQVERHAFGEYRTC